MTVKNITLREEESLRNIFLVETHSRDRITLFLIEVLHLENRIVQSLPTSSSQAYKEHLRTADP